MSHRVITISREFGSSGRTIGKDVAARLGIPCYDSEIIEKIAAKTGFAKEYIEKYREYAQSASLYDNALAGRTYDGQSDADKLWLAQKEVSTKLAQEGPCVIVGRCADYILRNTANCLTVFIHASDEKRAEQIVSVYGQREEPLPSSSGTRTTSGRPIMSFTPAPPGAAPTTTPCAWTAAC